MVIVVVVAQNAGSGVKVYVVVLKASKTGAQTPIIPSVEATGKGEPPGKTSAPSHKSSI
jgi:hypothetical protein